MEPSTVGKFAELPITLQVVMVSGFCAYLLAFVGIRHRHRPADTVFGSLAFGLAAAAVFASRAPDYSLLTIVLAFGAALIAGVAWRTVLRHWLSAAMRRTGYSHADDRNRAWDDLLESRNGATQLTVELIDGRYLYCTNASTFKDCAHGPFVLGTAGDVLIYADKIERPDGKEELPSVSDTHWGDLVTYVPREQIRAISVRYVGTNSPSGVAEASAD